MTESVVYLRDSSSGEMVEATLCDEVTDQHLALWDREWTPEMRAFAASATRQTPEDAHWNWKAKAGGWRTYLMKLEYPKEWFERSAEIEGDAEVGAGIPPTYRPSEEKIDVLDTRIAFGQFVELWRRNKGWDAEKLAHEAGIGAEEVLEIEHDPHCEPEPDAVFKLADVFGVPSRKLMELAGLAQNRTPRLREEAIRFAARSESLAKLSEMEHQALEAFVAALTSKSE